MTDTPTFDQLHVQPELDLRTEGGGTIVDARASVYGDPVENLCRIAQVWSGILGHEVQPTDVPLMMAGLKLVRTQVTPDYSDSSDDVDGFMEMFRRVVGSDMIHARSVGDYLLIKGAQL